MNNKKQLSPTLPFALRALALLALIIMAEVINGTVRTLAIAPLVGDFTARQIGTVTGCVLIGLIAWFGSPSMTQGWQPACPVGRRPAVAGADDGL